MNPVITSSDFDLYKIEAAGAFGSILLKKEGESWQPVYTFLEEHMVSADLQVANFFTSTHPSYIFTQNFICVLPSPNGRHILFNGSTSAREYPQSGNLERLLS
jgi:N-hydroxyarylamine O-acetyltransferase